MKLAIRLCVLICAFAVPAAAGPKHPRATRLDPALSAHVKAAEQAWTAAEHEQSAVLQPEAWEAAARAFAAVDADSVDSKVKTDAARAAVLAWENALEADTATKPPPSRGLDLSGSDVHPQPVPDREKALIAACDRFQAYVTDPSDPDLAGAVYLEARTYTRFDQLEAAIKLYRTILDHHRRHEVALYAANLLLDAYNRLHRYDELVALANELANDKAFLDGRDDLRDTVKKIQRAGARRKVEELERAAMDTHDADKYVAAGHAYLDIYNADPKTAEGDELLYNAGVSFEEGRAITAALQAFAQLAKQYSKSRITPKAIARQARIYADIAMFDKAAEKLETYAKTYAGEKDAYDALSDAVFYRKALGDRDSAVADANLFVKTFGAKRPQDAAAAKWSITSLFESDPARLLTHLQEYVKVFGHKGGPERLVIAHARIGQVLWKQSCPVPGFDGLCVKSNPQTPRSCGKGTIRTFVAVPRNPTKMKEALASFAAAIHELERSGTEDASARYYYAQAKLATSDADLEPYLGLAFPTLDFGDGSPEQRPKRLAGMKKFDEWMRAKTKGGERANRSYELVLGIKDAASAVTAAERIGLIAESFASTMITGAPPADLKRGPFPKEAVDAYCDAMTTAAEPLEEQSVKAFGVCLAKSTELAWFDDSSRICEHELTRMKPEDYPAAKERRIQATLATPVIALEPPTLY